jgi:hypothetical protein
VVGVIADQLSLVFQLLEASRQSSPLELFPGAQLARPCKRQTQQARARCSSSLDMRLGDRLDRK